MFPENSKFLLEAFNDATKNPHGYLLLDLLQPTPENKRIRTGILPHDQRILYTSI